MRRETLLDFFADLAGNSGTFLVHDDGFRTWRWSYRDVHAAAHDVAARLEALGLGKDDKVVFWGENRPEWIVAFWACLLRGSVVVPVDYRASPDFLAKVRTIVEARLIVLGDEVELPETAMARAVTRWRFRDLGPQDERGGDVAAGARRPAAAHIATANDVAEIIFTSGATAEPKGVIITHRNILANIVPIEREIRKYRRYAAPFSPIRFLNLLPLSHMFGQAMATFVPPMLAGEVIFMRSFNPQDVIEQIRSRRVSVLVSVPKILDVLRDHVRRRYPDAADPVKAKTHWLKRWWLYRSVHRAFGWKFWAAVVGAAPLDAELEEYWGRLGFLVIQGYGLTETAPIVTLNHPFSAKKGSVGKPIAGVEVRIADDGEILVRGDNVTTGYYGAPAATAQAFEDGWLHTGDIGGFDEQGRVFIRGRKKEMIVTPEGLNVFPEDVERALVELPGVRDAAVVGRNWSGEERVHAVLVLDAAHELDRVVRDANQRLGDHQKIRSASIWPRGELPRTEGTRKLKRRQIKDWVDAGEDTSTATTGARAASVLEIVARFAHGRSDVSAQTTIDELGLSSLERVELLMALEERYETTLDEARVATARSVGDLEDLIAVAAGATVESGGAVGAGVTPATVTTRTAREAGEGPVRFPRWNRTAPAYWLRRLSLPTWMLPLARVFVQVDVEGLDHLATLQGPVVFAANHQSHFDAPTVLCALPPRWRYRVAIAMAKEFFAAHFFPERHGRRAWLTSSLNYYLSALFFNAFPLPQREAGTRQTLRYIGALLAEGQSLLIFPEGKRTEAGEINVFRPGIGMIGARLNVPIVPVRLIGVDRVLHQRAKWPTRGPASVIFGAPLVLDGDDYAGLARRVEEAVRALGAPPAGPAEQQRKP